MHADAGPVLALCGVSTRRKPRKYAISRSFVPQTTANGHSARRDRKTVDRYIPSVTVSVPQCFRNCERVEFRSIKSRTDCMPRAERMYTWKWFENLREISEKIVWKKKKRKRQKNKSSRVRRRFDLVRQVRTMTDGWTVVFLSFMALSCGRVRYHNDVIGGIAQLTVSPQLRRPEPRYASRARVSWEKCLFNFLTIIRSNGASPLAPLSPDCRFPFAPRQRRHGRWCNSGRQTFWSRPALTVRF